MKLEKNNIINTLIANKQTISNLGLKSLN